MRRRGTEILEYAAPFSQQQFLESDLLLLQKAVGGSLEQDKTVVRITGRDVTLTRRDVCKIQDALVRRIRRWKNPDSGWLLQETRGGPCFIDSEGVPRIGLWLFSPEALPGGGDSLRFVWRRAGTYGPAFSASVTPTGSGWKVTRLGHLFIDPPIPGSRRA